MPTDPTLRRKLGHESPSATIDRYGHLMPGEQLRARVDDPRAAVRNLAEQILRDLDADGPGQR